MPDEFEEVENNGIQRSDILYYIAELLEQIGFLYVSLEDDA